MLMLVQSELRLLASARLQREDQAVRVKASSGQQKAAAWKMTRARQGMWHEEARRGEICFRFSGRRFGGKERFRRSIFRSRIPGWALLEE